MRESEPPRCSESAASAADEAMTALTRLFSSGRVFTNAYFRCSIDGPTEFDLFYDSMRSEPFACNLPTDYKIWIMRLYRLGLISAVPNEWKALKDVENC